MRFRLLGRLELVTANGAVVPPGAVSRAIVGRLLLAHGAVVQRDTLVDELWEERTTKNPVGALQVQMAKLRVAFAARGEDTRLLFDHGGYRIVLGPEDEVDVPDFEAAVRDGREHLAADEYEKAESELRRGCRCGAVAPWTAWRDGPSRPSGPALRIYGSALWRTPPPRASNSAAPRS